VLADPTQIHQIVMNLCTNALHAMEMDGGIIEVTLDTIEPPADKLQTPDGLESNRFLRLVITDTGCGMSDETCNKIFDPYFTTKEKGKGTGLGLAVVHGIVQSHGGTIEVTSSPGQGSRFEINFPITEITAPAAQESEEAILNGSGRILLVDDEPMLVKLAENILSGLGYQLACMLDPNQALKFIEENPQQYDLVITDLTMPGISGDKLAQKIAAIRPDLPILLSSGNIIKDINYECVAGFIRKPFSVKVLAQAVKAALNRSSSA